MNVLCVFMVCLCICMYMQHVLYIGVCMYVCMMYYLEVQLYVGVVCSCAIVLFHPLPSADFTGDPAQFQECY